MECVLLGLKTLGLILVFYFFSISLTFYNKWILMGYPFPLSITMIHLIIKFIISWVVRKATSCVSKHPPLVLGWKDYMKHMVPVAVLSALDIGLSNWSLVFITISLYTMSKSTALIFILFFAILLKLEQPRVTQILVVLLIVAGLFMFTFQSTTFDLEGFILVLVASIITGLRWTTAQLTLQKEELGLSNPIDTVFHLQPVMIITLLPLAIYVDGVHIGTSALVFRTPSMLSLALTAAFILVAALLAFMLGVSEYLLVYHTSGLTLSIAGIFKEIIVLTISTLWWEEEMPSIVNFVGMVVCVSGIALHILFKALRTNSKHIVISSNLY